MNIRRLCTLIPGSMIPAIQTICRAYGINTGILIGEFGTRLQTDKDRQWFQKLQSYIQAKHLNWTFWSLNPNSGDTGGLLLDDWQTVQQEKQAVLKAIQYPFIVSG